MGRLESAVPAIWPANLQTRLKINGSFRSISSQKCYAGMFFVDSGHIGDRIVFRMGSSERILKNVPSLGKYP